MVGGSWTEPSSYLRRSAAHPPPATASLRPPPCQPLYRCWAVTDDTLSRSPDDTSRKTHQTLRIRQFETHTLSFSGAPGVGDAFFKHVFNNQCHSDRVRRVPVTPAADDRRGFEGLPENSFDRSDRKFLAVAVAAHAVVLNATDSDWGEQAALMDKLGVEVRQLCPQHVSERTGRTRP